jgi:hypothetical protein
MTDTKTAVPPLCLPRKPEVFMTLTSIAVLSLVACGDASHPGREGSVRGPDSPSSEEAKTTTVDSETNARFRSALEDAVIDPAAHNGLHLIAACQRGSQFRSMRIFDTGVAIWGGELQFRLTESEITGLLQQLLAADFASLPDQYGGTPEPDRMQANSARSVVCSLSVAVAGAEKVVLQINRGEQSESFARLVNDLLDSCEEPAADGVGATTLVEGLEKVASGELDPAVFELHFQRLSDGAASEELEFILGIEGLTAGTRLRVPGGGYAEPSQLELTAAEVSELAWQLADNAPGRFPQNIWAPSYRELSIRVLNQELSLVARPYKGVDQETHGELQQDFDATIDLLESLHERVLEAGSSQATDA